jgi:hypothetical protein
LRAILEGTSRKLNKMFDLLNQVVFAEAFPLSIFYAVYQTHRLFGVPMWIVGIAIATVLAVGSCPEYVAQVWVYMGVFAFFAISELVQGLLFSWEERGVFAEN